MPTFNYNYETSLQHKYKFQWNYGDRFSLDLCCAATAFYGALFGIVNLVFPFHIINMPSVFSLCNSLIDSNAIIAKSLHLIDKPATLALCFSISEAVMTGMCYRKANKKEYFPSCTVMELDCRGRTQFPILMYPSFPNLLCSEDLAKFYTEIRDKVRTRYKF